MRYVVLIIAIFIIGRPALPVVDYIFNYKYITTQLCVNRDRPELHCNGKCYLMKAMADTAAKDRQEKKGNLMGGYKLPLLYFENCILQWDYLKFINHKNKVYDSYLLSYKFLIGKLHLRPPISGNLT